MTKLAKAMSRSFIKGLTSFMIIWPAPVSAQTAYPASDMKKLAADWKEVGNDLRSAGKKYERTDRKRRTGWV